MVSWIWGVSCSVYPRLISQIWIQLKVVRHTNHIHFLVLVFSHIITCYHWHNWHTKLTDKPIKMRTIFLTRMSSIRTWMITGRSRGARRRPLWSLSSPRARITMLSKRYLQTHTHTTLVSQPYKFQPHTLVHLHYCYRNKKTKCISYPPANTLPLNNLCLQNTIYCTRRGHVSLCQFCLIVSKSNTVRHWSEW